MPLRDVLLRVRSRFDGSGVEEAGDALEGLNLKTVGAAAAAAAFVGAAQQAGEYAVSIEQLSRSTGIAVEDASAFAQVLMETGEDVSGLRGLLLGLNVAIGEAAEGQQDRIDAFERLGISFQVLESADPGAKVRLLANAVESSNLPATELLSTLSSILGDEDAGILIGNAERLGSAVSRMSESDIRGASQAFQETQRAMAEFNAAILEITGALAPLATGAADVVTATRDLGFATHDLIGDVAGWITQSSQHTEVLKAIRDGSVTTAEGVRELAAEMRVAEGATGALVQALNNLDAAARRAQASAGATRRAWEEAAEAAGEAGRAGARARVNEPVLEGLRNRTGRGVAETVNRANDSAEFIGPRRPATEAGGIF